MHPHLARVLTLVCLVAGCGKQGADAPGASAAEPADAATSGAVDSGMPKRATGEAHYILARECPVSRLPADRPLVSGWKCSTDLTEPGRQHCTDGIECTHQEQCTDKPFGRCLGSGRASCDYGVATEPCKEDRDCVLVPGGHCLSRDPAVESCYPDGTCVPSTPYCHYEKLSAPCEQDADCDRLPGGRCAKEINHAACQYNSECVVDADCGKGKRCACTDGDMFCVLADCASDKDCASGQQCMPTPTCLGVGVAGYHCTTANDRCHGDSCESGYCAYSSSAMRWDCVVETCNVP